MRQYTSQFQGQFEFMETFGGLPINNLRKIIIFVEWKNYHPNFYQV